MLISQACAATLSLQVSVSAGVSVWPFPPPHVIQSPSFMCSVKCLSQIHTAVPVGFSQPVLADGDPKKNIFLKKLPCEQEVTGR